MCEYLSLILLRTDPGVFEFEKPSFLIKESVGVAQIPVTRANGCDGRVAILWVTKDLTAVSGQDYDGGEGALVFEHGETTKMIDINIINDLVMRFSYTLYCRLFYGQRCPVLDYL